MSMTVTTDITTMEVTVMRTATRTTGGDSIIDNENTTTCANYY